MATSTMHVPGPAVRAPWHLWVVGGLGVLWNSFGCFDYFMSKTRGDPYLVAAGMSPEQIVYFHAMPAWMTAVWAVGVWGAMAGTVLLLMRSRHAVPVYVASLISFVLSVVYQRLVAPMPGNDATALIVMQLVIFAGCVFFVWYSLRARRLGLLR